MYLMLLWACGLSPFNSEWRDTSTTAVDSTTSSESEAAVDTAVDEISFVVFGDAGTGSSAQEDTATALVQLCARDGCDFIVHLGSNIYNSGVTSTADEAFAEKFEDPYSSLDGPFYMVLGDHDYGSNGNGYDEERALAQVDYTNLSDKWVMKDRYWYTDRGQARLAFFDTVQIHRDDGEVHKAWTENVAENTNKAWKLGFGHQTYISNGRHGNAGSYQGITDPEAEDAGADLQAFFESSVCGKYHIYFAASDKNLQWLEPTCGTEFVVSGSGASTTPLEDRGNDTHFEEETLGFVYVTLTADQLDMTFYDQDLEELYAGSLTPSEAGGR